MRWDFIDPPTAEDVRQREIALEGIERWWAAFESNCDAIDEYFTQGLAFDIRSFLAQNLQSIHPGLMWEFGRAKTKEGHRLVITPEAEKGLRPLMRALLERAPSLPRWEFYGHRLPEPEMVWSMIEARTGHTVEEVKGRASLGDSHRIDVAFCIPSLSDPDARDHAAFVGAETLFGEELLDSWIGAIDATDDPGGEDWLGVAQLKSEVEAIQQRLLETLADKPCHAIQEEVSWCMFQLEPTEAEDYPEQRDLFVAKAMLQDMWRTAHDGTPFYSARFSRVGETFCFLKLDGKEGIDEERFEDKSQIEDALDEALIPEGLGCCIGGGTGLRYSYIDLALTDVPRALEAIKAVLREGKVPQRSWLLFCDDELRDEWVGIWEETPPPPQ